MPHDDSTKHVVNNVSLQDVMGLVRNLYLVLTDEQVRLQLQLNARQTAEQFTPVAIAERWVMTTPDIKGQIPCLRASELCIQTVCSGTGCISAPQSACNLVLQVRHCL